LYHNDTGAVLELQSIQWSEVVQPEIVIGLFGVIVLVCGTRLYRLSVMAPGFLLGWYLSLHIISGVSPAVQLMMVLLSSILGGIAMLFLEQLAISLMGALIGGGLIQELVTVNQQEWYWPILGAFLGALIFPSIFKKSLTIVTAGIGALCIAYSCNELNNVLGIIGLSLFGWITQRWFLRKKRTYLD